MGSERLIGQLERAITGFEQVILAYLKDGDEAATARRVKPLGLLFGRFGYLVGLETGKGVRTYRLNCIEGVELVGKTFKPPAWFNVKSWAAESFGIYHGDELKTWRITFSPRVAARAATVFFHPTEQKRVLASGELELILNCRGERELRHEFEYHPDWIGEVKIYDWP